MEGIQAVRGLEPISSLAPEQIDELLAQSAVESLSAGTRVQRPAGPERQAIYLLEGDVEVAGAGFGDFVGRLGGGFFCRRFGHDEEVN